MSILTTRRSIGRVNRPIKVNGFLSGIPDFKIRYSNAWSNDLLRSTDCGSSSFLQLPNTIVKSSKLSSDPYPKIPLSPNKPQIFISPIFPLISSFNSLIPIPPHNNRQ